MSSRKPVNRATNKNKGIQQNKERREEKKDYKKKIEKFVSGLNSTYKKKGNLLISKITDDSNIAEIEETINVLSAKMVQEFKEFYGLVLDKLKEV